MKKFKEVNENFTSAFTDVKESNIDNKNFIIKNVCTFGRAKSLNGYTYTPQAIKKIAEMTEGLKCFKNHPGKDVMKNNSGVRDVADWIGVYRNPTQNGDKIYADLHCREAYFPMLKDIATLQPKAVGNSINARVKLFVGEDGQESVVDVDMLRSGDICSSCATTDNLFESKNEVEEIRIKNLESAMDKLLIREGIVKEDLNDNVKEELKDLLWKSSDLMFKSMIDKNINKSEIFENLEKEISKKLKNTESTKENLNKEDKENEKMALTIEQVKENKEIFEAIVNEIKNTEESKKAQTDLTDAKAELKAKDSKIDELTESLKTANEAKEATEKDLNEAKVKLDEIEVAAKFQEKKETIQTLLTESEIDKDLVTDIFKTQLEAVKATDEVTVEEGIKALIEDRKGLVKGTGKVKAGEEFVEKKENKKENKEVEITEADIDGFCKSYKK